MIITILREEYLALIDTYRYCHRLRCSKTRLMQTFKWLSKNGLSAVQLANEEIRLKFLGESLSDAMLQGGFAEGIAAHADLGGAR